MNKKWEICECDKTFVEQVAKENNISEWMATLLVNRGIRADQK